MVVLRSPKRLLIGGLGVGLILVMVVLMGTIILGMVNATGVILT